MENSLKPSPAVKLPRGFYWMATTAFLGAFNDNIFRWMMITFLLVRLEGEMSPKSIMAWGSAVFVIPFLLFIAAAGNGADRFSKQRIIFLTKCMEVGVMLLGCVAFYTQNIYFLYCIVFFMSAQSAFFSPSKYGILPELVGNERLSKANGMLEMFTYIAIILGTVLGFNLSKLAGDRHGTYALICVGIAGIGILTSIGIPKTVAAGGRNKASWLVVKDIWNTLYEIRGQRLLIIAVIASAAFLFIGGFVQNNIVEYGTDTFNLKVHQSSFLYLVAALGIGIGSVFAGKISGCRIELGLVPLGGVGMTLSMLLLGLVPGSWTAICILLFILGFSGGLFTVPLHAFIQKESPNERRGEVLAASSFLSWVGVLISAGVLLLLDAAKVSASVCFFLFGLFALVLSIAMIRVLPDFFARLMFLIVTRFIYRIKTVGCENVPAEGGALIVSNHVSWVDGLLIMATQPRPVRFLIAREYYNMWWIKPVMKLGRMVPISHRPKEIVKAFEEAREHLANGDLVCIFPEGGITRTSAMAGFRPGLERILKDTDVPVIPTYIGGAWGSIFSYAKRKLFGSLPKVSYSVSIHFGQPLPAQTPSFEIRQKVCELSSDYFNHRKNRKRNLVNIFIQTARRNFWRQAVSDITGKSLSYNKLLVATLTLGDKLREPLGHQKMIGLLLPSSVGGAVANLAMSTLGKIPVNLNYTVGGAAMRSTVDQCGIESVITSRKFLENISEELHPDNPIFLEEIMPQIGKGDKFRALLKAWLCPRFILSRRGSFDPDNMATIIFSSGSTAAPKGIMLSHHNLISNIEAMRTALHFSMTDNICGILPFFHSFGYAVTIWLPLLTGISVSYCPNPLDAKQIGKTVRENRSTLLLATPTFLAGYTRRVEADDFKSLRLVLLGAEKLKKCIADAFEEKFGLRPLEGYGATELSPVVTLNLPDVTAGGSTQIATREGTVGHPLPGIATRIVDPASDAELPQGETGLLLVKGPNVMLGYLNNEEKTREVLRDSWYTTGDIARIDEDGFITITDRLARFSKIGGEMVAHIAIEEVLQQAAACDDPCVAVTSVPDEKKGEQLVVLYLEQAGEMEALQAAVEGSNLSNMSKPRKDNYIKIDALPVLGTGKLDILGLRKLATQAKTQPQIT